MSAGSSEPARLPRCLTPLMYGNALVIRYLAIDLSTCLADMKKPFARKGWRERRVASARASSFRPVLWKGPGHSRSDGKAQAAHALVYRDFATSGQGAMPAAHKPVQAFYPSMEPRIRTC